MQIIKFFFALSIFLHLIVACSPDNPIVKKPIDCPPYNWPTAIAANPNYISLITVTNDYKYLFYYSINRGQTRIVDLSTLTDEIFDFSLYNNDTLTITNVWSILTCPYDSKLLLLNCSANLNNETNLETFALLLDFESKKVLTIVQGRFFMKWMEYSKQNSDYFAEHQGTYNLQSGKFTLNNKPYISYNTTYSYDGLNSITYGVNSLIMNGETLPISDTLSRGIGNFSRDGKKVLMTATNFSGANADRHQEIWVIDFAYFLRTGSKKLKYDIISLRDNFCKYNLSDAPGAQYPAEFIAKFTSNNTIIVVMHNDYNSQDKKAYIYEISVNGEMIRQITF